MGLVRMAARTAVVAGTAPASRMAASDPRAVSRLCGAGSPWAMRDDSSATIGRPESSASRTSSEMRRGTAAVTRTA